MIMVENLRKKFLNGDLFYDYVLDGISINFANKGLVSILGESGSGKSTFLSILGGFLSYDEGDIFINNVSLKKFGKELDYYRNNYVGFVFQSYNLIDDLTVFQNVKLALDFNKKHDEQYIYDVLEELNLSSYINQYPCNLSGGERQRVAIARAIVKKPKIIFCDEPTGALDSVNSNKIMKILKKLSLNCLVIVVSHDEKLAKKYSDRIVKIKDGKILEDSGDQSCIEKEEELTFLKKHISFKDLFFMAVNFLKRKKRNIFLCIGLAISILSLTLVYAISDGFDRKVNILKKDMASIYPIGIEEYAVDIYSASKIGKDDVVVRDTDSGVYHNNINQDVDKYIKNIDSSELDSIMYKNPYLLPVVRKDKVINSVSLGDYLYTIPYNNEDNLVDKQYDFIAGRNIEKYNELLLVVSDKYSLDDSFLKNINLSSNEFNYKDLLGLDYKLLFYDDYFKKQNNIFKVNDNLNNIYQKGIDLKVVGIIKAKENYSLNKSSIFLCGPDLFNSFASFNKDSELLKLQSEVNYNVFSGNNISSYDKNKILSSLTYNSFSLNYYLYPRNYESKNRIINYLNNYKEKLVINDSINLVTDVSKTLIDIITLLLLFFSVISFFISIIMVGVIFYINVLERKKEIGLLRCLGARKLDISMMFYLEAILIGIISGICGVLIARCLFFPVNMIVYKVIEIENILSINIYNGIIFILFSILLTLIGSYLPIYKLSNKEPFSCLFDK